MAEKKVSSKRTSNIRHKNSLSSVLQDSEYEDFLAKHAPDLRKRATRTVAEPKKKDIRQELSKDENKVRCGEMNPHTTTNPALQRQIMTKRTGRIISDDTGFKSMPYNNRFELQPEMSDELVGNDDDEDGSTNDHNFPGQQTMADIVAMSGNDNISVPVEPAIDDNPFTGAYNSLKESGEMAFGKSEKLKAIARTAADDAGMEPNSQLSFPAFDPLFKFTDNQYAESADSSERTKKRNKTKNSEHKKSSKEKEQKKSREKDIADEKTIFDIEEDEILTVVDKTENTTDKEKNANTTETEQPSNNDNKDKIFKLLEESEKDTDREPPFEIEGKSDIKPGCEKIIQARKTNLIKCACILLLGIVLSIISAVYNSTETGSLHSSYAVYPTICFFFTLAASIISIKELFEGIQDIRHLKCTSNFGCVIILLSSFIQTTMTFFSGSNAEGTFHILAPVAIFSILWTIVPKIMAADNALNTIKIMAENSPVTVFKPLYDGGIEGSVKEQFASDNTDVRYLQKTSFMSGLIKELTMPVPKTFGMGTAFAMVMFFSIIVAVATGIINGSAICAMTSFTGMIIICIPISHTFCSAYFVVKQNKNLAKSNSSIISCKTSQRLNKTSSVIFDADDIIEKSSCSIHGIKSFGRRDPKKVTLYAASVMNASRSPLTEFMQQATVESDEEVPEAEETKIVYSKGVKATVGNIPVLFGTKEFMEECNVLLPSEDFEEKFITGDRKLLYFAVANEFSMLFVVSYHIKRSTASFFKYLSERNIKIIVNSCDPNITTDYITKKCRLSQGSVTTLDEFQSSYFTEKSDKVESSLPADVFTDGKLTSISKLMTSSAHVAKSLDTLPLVVYAFSFIGALCIAIPALSGSVYIIGNLFVFIIKAICSILCILIPSVLPERK